MQNFQKRLHEGPNSTVQTSDDVITKEEFEFKPLVQFQRPLKLIQKLSALTSLFALYQLAYGGLSFSYLPSSFNLASTSLGLLSLLLSIFLAIWSTKALKAERDKTLLTQDTVEKTLETASKVLLLSILIRVAASCVMMPMMVSQGTQTADHLWAYDSTYNVPKYTSVADTLKNLIIPIPFFELFSCMTFMYAAWTCFRYVKSPGQLISKLVSISNLAFMGASLALIYNTLSVEKDFENLMAPSLMPQWNITSLKYAGILAGVMSGLTWLANSKKWRVPSFAVIGLMTALVLSLGVFTVHRYTSANAISEFYQDTTDMNIWNSKMWNVDAKDIEAFGCPAKYLPSERCQGSLLVNRWEQNPADSRPAHCLNIACSDILGSLYSSPFLQLSTWAMASVVTGLIVIAGSLYLSMTSFRDTAPRTKKDYGWLGALIAMAVVFTVAVNIMPSKPFINESGLSMEGLFQTEENRMRSEGYDKWFGGSGVEMDSDLSKMVSRMFLLKENRFIRMRLNKDYDRVLLTQAGDYSLQYQDLIDNLNPYRAEIAFARVPLDSRHDAIVGIVWIPYPISPIERETYLRYYAVDQTDLRGFPVYVATDKESLDKNVVLANVFRDRTVFLEDEYLEVNEQDLIMQRQEMMTTIMAEIPTPLEMSPEDGQELFLMVLAKIYKFIVVNLDIENKKAAIEARGDWQSTYNDFVQNFNVGDAKVGLIYLDVEGKTRLVAVIFENDQLAQMLQNRNTLPDISKLQQMGISLYIINDPAQLNLDTLMSAITSQDQTQQQITQLIEMPYAVRREAKYIEKMRERFQLNLMADVGQASSAVSEDLGLKIFDLVAEQKYKFLLQRYNTDENKVELVGTGQWNESNYTTFVKLINTNEPQVGYIFLELEGEKRLVLIVYAPQPQYSDVKAVFKMFNLPSDPRRLESIGLHVYFAHKPADLDLEFILKAIFGDDSSLRKLLVMLDLENYVVPENKEMRMLAVDDSQSGDTILDTMVNDKAYKYVILKEDPANNLTYIAKSGDWSSSFNKFVQDVDRGEAQVALYYLQLETIQKLVAITYVPLATLKTSEQVLTDFGLSSQVLAQRGVSLYTSISKNDLQVKKVLRAIYTDVPAVMQMIQVLLEDEEGDDSPLTSADVTPLAVPPVSPGPPGSAPRGRQGKPGKGPVESEQMEELIRDKDQIDLKLKAVDEGGDSPLTSADVTPLGSYPRGRQGKPGKGPVESEEMEELIRDKDQIDLKSKAVLLEQDDSPLTSADITPLGSYPRGRQGKPGKGPVESEEMEELIRDKDQIDLKLKAVDEGNDSPLTSADVTPLGSYPRGRQGKPGKGPVESEEMEELIRDKDQIDMNLLFGWGKMGLKLSSDIVKPLKSKKVKYIILKQDADNAVYIASNGTWYATFDQFVKEFNSSVPQVGFIYLEVEGEEKLVMVVYAPDIVNGDARQVVKDFKVTKKDAAKLKKKGIFTFVVNDLANLTVENAMNSVYSQENQPIIKLMSLMQLYDINIDDYVSNREQAQMMLLDKKGLTLSRSIIQQIVSKNNKYTILTKDASGNYNVAKTGTWHATFDQFVKDFTPTDDQLGFINLEIEQVRKLVMIVYAPNSPDKTDEEVFSDFNPAKSVAKLEKNDVSVYFARILGNINLDMVLNKVFNVRNPSLTSPVVTLAPNIAALNLPADIGDALQNQKYKYVVLSQDVQKDIISVDVSGAWGTEYKKFVKDFSGKKDQIALIYLDIESKPRLVLVVFSDKIAPSQILRNFGLPDNEAILQEAGVQLYVIRKKKELDIFTLLEGIYSQDTYTQSQLMLFEIEGTKLNLFEESDLPLGKDVVDALTNKKYKYMICTHDIKTDTTTVQSTGAWGSTYKDFVKDFTKKDKQIGFIFLEAEAKEILVMIIFAPKVAGTSALKEFGLPDNVAALNNIGIKPYIAHKKKELDLGKVLEGVYSNGTFEQNNPVVF